jgi:replication-associated recombination protein RarA
MNDRYLPDEMAGRVYYGPKERGAEGGIKARLDRWRQEREVRGSGEGSR